MDKKCLQELIGKYEILVKDEQTFRNPIMIADEFGWLPIKPHDIDAIRSIEREYVYKQTIIELKNLMK